jgi:c-di-GMP-binding flagellar brake protein YcgR
MNDSSPLPEPPSPGIEQYTLYSRVEITGVMRDIAERGVLVTLYYGSAGGFILSSLLSVNPDFEELVFDCGANARDNDALLRSNHIVSVTFLDHVKVQFAAQRAQATMFDGRPAIRIRLPDSILRLQRRDAFRVSLPIARPITMLVPVDSAGAPFEMRLVDISCGGACVAAPAGGRKFEPGVVLEDCRINLPDAGAITCAVEVRYVSLTRAIQGAQQLRYGLRFLRLPGPMATVVQRFINKLQRDWHTITSR